jgi:hypothetical protein
MVQKRVVQKRVQLSDLAFSGITTGVLGALGALSVETTCCSCDVAVFMLGQAWAIETDPAAKAKAMTKGSIRIVHPPVVEIKVI